MAEGVAGSGKATAGDGSRRVFDPETGEEIIIPSAQQSARYLAEAAAQYPVSLGVGDAAFAVTDTGVRLALNDALPVLPGQQRVVSDVYPGPASSNMSDADWAKFLKDFDATFKGGSAAAPATADASDEIVVTATKQQVAAAKAKGASGKNASGGRIDVLLPVSGKGFRTYGNDGNDHYGTARTISAIESIASSWSDMGNSPFSIGDISRRGGGPLSPHKSHKTGIDVDVRPIRKDGNGGAVTWKSSDYDRGKTTQLIAVIKSQHHNASVFFNDPVLVRAGITLRVPGHDNHLHIRFK